MMRAIVAARRAATTDRQKRTVAIAHRMTASEYSLTLEHAQLNDG